MPYLPRSCLILLICVLLAGCGSEEDGSADIVFRDGLADVLPLAPELNVLVVSFDAMRADAMGVYGGNHGTTPNLDAFAEAALTFENAYSAAPVTPTSFAAAFSGQYPYRVFLGWQMMPIITLAQAMKDSGRNTFGVFNNVQLAAERHFDQGFEIFEAADLTEQKVLARAGELLTVNREQPFFGWVHFISPHTPYQFREMSKHLAPPATEGRFAVAVPANYHVESEAELERARELYEGEMYFADHLFGRLLATLEQLDLMDRTLIVVTADHGEEFMDHGKVGHKSLHEEVIRIPMLIRHPGATAGSRTDIPYINIDLLPTLASTLGLPVPAGIDGIDLRQAIPVPRTRIVTEMTSGERYQMAIERGGRKLMQICRPEFREEMYDLSADRLEQSDILLDDPGLASRLTEKLLGMTQTEPCQLIVNSVRGKAPEDLLSDEQIEELRSLGYIQ